MELEYKQPGDTQLVELKNIKNKFGLKCNIFGKYEATNPTGSIKDRPVFNMLVAYTEKYKDLKGYTIVEATSGNTGIALAYFSNFFEYRCLMKVAVLFLGIFGLFDIWTFLYFILFEVSYEFAGYINKLNQ